MSLLGSQHIAAAVGPSGIVNVHCPGDHFHSVLKVVKGVCKEQLIFDNPIEALADRVVRSFPVLGHAGPDLVAVQKALE